MVMGPPDSLYNVNMSWSRTLREEHSLRVFENRVLWKIFGHRRDGVTEDWKRLQNEEFYSLYSSPNIVCVIKSEG